MIPLTLYWIIPSLASLYYSLTNYSVVMPTEWVGLANFSRMADDGLFWRSLKNTLLYTVGYIPLTMLFGLILALVRQRGHPRPAHLPRGVLPAGGHVHYRALHGLVVAV